ncbi:MAG TPA: CHRD domain-containing protein [Candidatus Limnocylindrales bacterium]|nr:CHRD domain-containing protein [Candidatus Limnocylindrales bacterium]
MRKFVSLIASTVLVAACGGTAAAPSTSPSPSPSPTASPAPTPQLKYTFVADLKTSNEVPAIADAEASCAGKGTFTLNTTKDTAGTITAATAQFDLTITGCPANTEITLFHIHKAAAGANGGVLVDSGQKAAEPIVLTTGATASTVTKTQTTVKPEDAKAIIDAPSGHYFNVHSKLHGGGVIRGQLSAS